MGNVACNFVITLVPNITEFINGLLSSVIKMYTCNCLFGVLLLSLTTCHQSASVSQMPHTLSKATFHPSTQDSHQSPSDELIHVYLSNNKLILRLGGLNQTLQFGTSVDQKLLVETGFNLIGESDTYQSSYERIFGIYKLPLAYCIAFIRSSEPANNFLGSDYGVKKIKEISYVIIPTACNSLMVPGSAEVSSMSIELAKQKEAISLMQSTFSRHSFYYSSQFFDVTRNFQSSSFQLAKAAIDESSVSSLEEVRAGGFTIYISVVSSGEALFFSIHNSYRTFNYESSTQRFSFHSIPYTFSIITDF